MLFDLRSRGRRRTVQAVYLGLALLMGGGLVLFGVGTGNGNGGLLNAFSGGGSSGAQVQALSSQEKAALKQTRLSPNDPNAWAALVSARWDNASTGSNYDSSTNTFTAGGKKELAATVAAWQRYLHLTKSPTPISPSSPPVPTASWATTRARPAPGRSRRRQPQRRSRLRV